MLFAPTVLVLSFVATSSSGGGGGGGGDSSVKTVLIKDLTVRGRCVGCVGPSKTPQNLTEPRLAG